MPDPKGILGFDASHWQPSINWDTVVAGDRKFCILKVTGGLGEPDPMFPIRRQACEDRNFPWGGYDFFLPDLDPEDEAKKFTDALGGNFGQTGIWLDVENSTRPLVASDGPAVLACWDAIQQQAGRACGFYGPQSTLELLGLTFPGDPPPLWLAHPGLVVTRIPAPWTFVSIHQYDMHGQVEGIAGEVDLDVILSPLTET